MCHRFLRWHRRPGAGDCNAGAAARGDASRFPRLAPPPLFPRRFGSAPRPESPLAARGEESYTSDRPSLVHGGTSMTRARPASTPPPRPAGTPLPGRRPTRRRWRALAFPVTLSVTTLVATAPPAAPPRSIIQTAGELAAAELRSPLAGLTTSRAPDVLREQLALESGAGLVVDAVAVGSAAERAGLKRHDLLVALDGQLLVLPEQLAMLAASAPPSAPLVLDVRRGGRSFSLRIGAAPGSADDTAPAVATGTPPVDAVPAAAAAPPPRRPPPPPLAGARRIGPEAVVLEDRDCRLKVYRDGDTYLTVRDGRGWLVFNGPIATPAQRSLIPRRVRDRVESLETMLDTVADQVPAAVADTATALPPPPAPATPHPSVAPPAAAPPPGPVAEVGSLDVAPIEIR